MAERFGLNQGSNNDRKYAEVYVPNCGKMVQDDAPIIYIELDPSGKPVIYVWADINQEDWTHRIELKDALESNREISDVGKAENGSG